MFHISVGDTGFLHPNLVENPFFIRVNGVVPAEELKYCCARFGSPLEVKVISIRPWTSYSWTKGTEYSTFAKETIKIAFSRSDSEVYLPFSEELLEVVVLGNEEDYTWTIMGKQFTPNRDGCV